MPAVTHSADYLKFFFKATPERANELYRQFVEAVHQLPEKMQQRGNFKLNALGAVGVGPRRYTIEAWGSVSLAYQYLPAEPWFGMLTRVDFRATLWEVTREDILNVGYALAKHDSPYNINVFHSQERSKKGGRSAGGRGFAIGSHKSDLRVAFYKRGHEMPALEYQVQGKMLDRLKVDAASSPVPHSKLTGLILRLCTLVERVGNARTARCFERAGLGTYWPTYATDSGEDFQLPDTTALAIEAEFQDPPTPTQPPLLQE